MSKVQTARAQRTLPRRHKFFRFGVVLMLSTALGASAQELHVVHWWKSASERKAMESIAASLQRAGLAWVNENAGDGIGVSIVLRSRILARDMPDIVQATNTASYDWERLGLVMELDKVAGPDRWERRLLPIIYQRIAPEGHVLAAPLGVHRVNTMLFNKHVFERQRLNPPRTWKEFELVAPHLQRAGVIPLAQSSEPWQIAILFENLLLADGGVELHHRMFVDNDASAFTSSALAGVLRHLRGLKRWMRQPIPETDWTVIAGEVGKGAAAMTVSGDWLKGELQGAGVQVDVAIGCSAAPGTASIHLFDLDTLVMMRSKRVPPAAQEAVAKLAVSAGLQERYNRIKGSVPVLRTVDLNAMDSCARASWNKLADPAATVVQSNVVGTIGGQVMRDALIAEIHRFFMDESIAVQDTQRRLAAVSRAISQEHIP
jgi:glucose/mannose transport system substrate-binding protein